jgi:hypothetical protein
MGSKSLQVLTVTFLGADVGTEAINIVIIQMLSCL